MRPGDFSPGNRLVAVTIGGLDERFNEAGGFLPRKLTDPIRDGARRHRGFNEAGGFLPRKHGSTTFNIPDLRGASMRPGDFSPGNAQSCVIRYETY